MTVTVQTNRASYSGNGITTAFTIPFRILEANHVQVILRTAAGAETVKTYLTDYTTSGAGNSSATLNMVVAPVVGETLIILRDVPLTQEKEYVEGGSFSAKSHEQGLDKLTMIVQQFGEQLDRAIVIPPGDDPTNLGKRAVLVAPGQTAPLLDIDALKGNALALNVAGEFAPAGPGGTLTTDSILDATELGKALMRAINGDAALTAQGAGAGGLSVLKATTVAAVIALLPAFVASGAGHEKGLVPDPGAVAGTTRFLNEDGTWKSPFAGIYHAVTEGGCDNTGSVANGTQVQAAIDAATAAGKECYFPAGTYRLDGVRVRIPSGARVTGDGKHRTIFTRNADTAQGTFEVFSASNVVLRGFQVNYTAGTYTLGYPQTGICVRSGSNHVLVQDCAVAGKVNRQFQVINSSNIYVRDCIGIGGGNAALRVVSDNAANVYAGFTDEVTTWGGSRNIWFDNCVFSGATTLEGSTRAGTSYGVNFATEAGGSDFLDHVYCTNSRVRYTNSQGFQASGKAQNIQFTACHASFVDDGAGGGVGFLAQVYSTNYLQRSCFTACKAEFCTYGFWALDALYVNFDGCFAWGCVDGGRQTNGQYVGWIGCDFSANSAYGINLLGAASYSRVVGGNCSGNATGVYFDGTTSNCAYIGITAVANSVSNYGINGTGHVAGNK